VAIDIAREVFIPLGQAGADAFDDTRTWVDPNGRRLSDRLWLARQADRDAIDAILRGAVASGDDPLKAAKRLEDYLTPVGAATRTATPRSGMGNYAARRLARTEMTRAFGQATLQAAALNPFVEGVKWNLSGAHSKPDECDSKARRSSRGMEPGEYTLRDVPSYPTHPNCLCYLSPVTVKDTDAVVERLRREAALSDEALGVERAESFARSLGVSDVNYGGNQAIADIATNALRSYARTGVPVPQRISVVSLGEEGNVAQFQKRAISINADSPVWTDPALVREWHESRWLAAETPEGILHHEFTHAAHLNSLTLEQRIAVQRTSAVVPDADLVRREVSHYAATNPSEFVAEVFTGRLAGQSYSPRVLEIYENFWGPSLP
jgi:hypothetical protein